MSHELRTPLNAIAGHLQLLEMELHGPLTKAQHDALERIDRAERHLLSLVNDVLNLARIETGRVEYDIHPLFVRDLLRDVSALVGPQFAAKAIRFEVRLPEDEPGVSAVRVQADREKLLQVLTNLLGNAAKFTPNGGHVTLGLRTRSEGSNVAFIEVTDTGPGIPADKQEAIFAPFVQVHVGPKRGNEGSGLGLAISRDLARGMGGDLILERSSKDGSTFTVELPRATGTPALSSR
jgi:signal transduction histidine kinase